MKFQIYTLGCKVNTYESEMMKEKMLASGYVYDEENPDIIIVNTCSVTNMADHKSQKMVRHFKRNIGLPPCRHYAVAAVFIRGTIFQPRRRRKTIFTSGNC